MEWLQDVAFVVGLFILRIGVPLAIIFGLGYGLRQLDAKWQAEAMAEKATDLARQAGLEPNIELIKIIDPPCWLTNDCPKSNFVQCAAYKNPDTPCWLARYRAEGQLQSRCYLCPRFVPREKSTVPALTQN
jgi:hypothetical protein